MTRLRPGRVLAISSVTLAALGAAPALAAAPGATILVSRPAAFGPLASPATNDSFTTLGDDGGSHLVADDDTHRFIAFVSDADGLSDADDDRVHNVYVRDRLLATTILVSRADGPAGAGANGASDDPSISSRRPLRRVREQRHEPRARRDRRRLARLRARPPGGHDPPARPRRRPGRRDRRRRLVLALAHRRRRQPGGGLHERRGQPRRRADRPAPGLRARRGPGRHGDGQPARRRRTRRGTARRATPRSRPTGPTSRSSRPRPTSSPATPT